jgi:hypothetical protein
MMIVGHAFVQNLRREPRSEHAARHRLHRLAAEPIPAQLFAFVEAHGNGCPKVRPGGP